MHKLLFATLTLMLTACAEQPLVAEQANAADCRNREVRLGTNIPKRDDCTVVTDADRDAAQREAQAMRDEQARRTQSRPRAPGQ